MTKIFIVHGPNLSNLGERPAEIYGHQTYSDLCAELARECEKRALDCTFFQSNHEGELIEFFQDAKGKYAGGLCNLGGYSHTSVAIRDAIELSQLPVIEVHLSNVHSREWYRHSLVTASACIGVVAGFGLDGYRSALDLLSNNMAVERGS